MFDAAGVRLLVQRERTFVLTFRHFYRENLLDQKKGERKTKRQNVQSSPSVTSGRACCCDPGVTCHSCHAMAKTHTGHQHVRQVPVLECQLKFELISQLSVNFVDLRSLSYQLKKSDSADN